MPAIARAINGPVRVLTRSPVFVFANRSQGVAQGVLQVPRHRRGTECGDVVGGGQGGLAIAFQLLRERVQNIQVIDAAEAGKEGPWLNYARMPTLRSPKEVNGPDLNIPSLAF